MDFKWFVFLSLSIFIGAILGWLRITKISSAWYPLIFCLTAGAVNEILSYWLTAHHYTTAVNNNIYVLLEALLILWQFYNWQAFTLHKKFFIGLVLFTIIAWLFEAFYINRIHAISYYFRIYYSLTIVVLAILINSRLIITYRYSLLKNATFLTCAAFIIFFSYKILVEIFWLYGFNATPVFRVNVYTILAWVNCFTNLIYAMAILWIPSKQPYSMPSW